MGLFYGNPNLLVIQLIAVIVVGAFAFIGSFILLKAINVFSKIRVSPEEEKKGLDQSQYGEEAYRFEQNKSSYMMLGN
jgi:Amt family ammonium transporter